MAREYRFAVGPREAGMRLDRFLVRRLLESVSRSIIQRVVREGAVTVGGRPTKVHYTLHRGEIVMARVDQAPSPPADVRLTPQAIPLEVVFEDDHLLVVNKPAGLVTHQAPGHWDGTLVNAILWHLQQGEGSRVKGEGSCLHPAPSTLHRPLPRAGIIHRLDKDTSGLLLVAKTPVAYTALSKQMKARTIRRRYLALVEGQVPLDEGMVSAAIGRHVTHRKEMTVRHLGGRSAVTHYHVLKRASVPAQSIVDSSQSIDKTGKREFFQYTILEVTLDTGRTHQIRVHMAHLGYPVVGDTTYGKHPASFWQAVGIARQLLHAYAIRLLHPVTQQPIELQAPVPDDMAYWIPSKVTLEISR